MSIRNLDVSPFPWPRIDAEAVALRNRLLAASGRLAFAAGASRWKVHFLGAPARGYRAAYVAEASLGGRVARLDVDRLPLPRLLGHPLEGVPPLEVPEDLLPALLEGVLAGLLAAAETALGVPVRLERAWAVGPEALAGPDPEGHRVDLGLAEEEGIGRVRARLFLAEEDVSALADAADRAVAAERAAALAGAVHGGENGEPGPWAAVPLRLVVRAGETSLPAEDLAGLAPGDVVLLDRDPDSEGALRVGVGEDGRERFIWAGTRMGEAAVIEKEIVVENLDKAAAPEGVAANLEAVEVPLAFDLGARPATLAELRSLAAGSVLVLPDNPEGRVTLRAGGRVIGAGTLVMVGDRAGVRVDALWKGE